MFYLIGILLRLAGYVVIGLIIAAGCVLLAPFGLIYLTGKAAMHARVGTVRRVRYAPATGNSDSQLLPQIDQSFPLAADYRVGDYGPVASLLRGPE